MVQQRVDGLLVALEDVEDAVGQARLAPQLGHPSDADGSFSLGLSTTVLPAAMASGKNHIGTMAGKLNGADDADDAERLALGVDVDAGGDLLGVAALEQVRDAAGELHDLLAARHLAGGVGEHLAVLGGDDRGELAARSLSSSRKRKTTWVRAATEVAAQPGAAAAALAMTRSASAARRGRRGRSPPRWRGW